MSVIYDRNSFSNDFVFQYIMIYRLRTDKDIQIWNIRKGYLYKNYEQGRMIIYLYRYYGIWTYYHCRTMLCCLILIVLFSNLIICLYRLILWLILEYGNCANRCKNGQQQLSVEADGKNGHIIYDVDLIVLDILKVAEYLGRVCYEKKSVTYDAK